MNISLKHWTRYWLIDGEHLYRRVLQMLVAFALLAWIGVTWYQTEQRGQEVRMLQTEQLARVVLAQANHEARIWLLEENGNGLAGLAEHLQQQDGILEVSIQDAQGRSIVRAGHSQPVHTYLNSLPTYMWAVPMVSGIDHGGQNIGFIRITFDYHRILADADVYQRVNMQRTGFILFLSALAGFLLATSVLKRRPRHVQPM